MLPRTWSLDRRAVSKARCRPSQMRATSALEAMRPQRVQQMPLAYAPSFGAQVTTEPPRKRLHGPFRATPAPPPQPTCLCAKLCPRADGKLPTEAAAKLRAAAEVILRAGDAASFTAELQGLRLAPIKYDLLECSCCVTVWSWRCSRPKGRTFPAVANLLRRRSRGSSPSQSRRVLSRRTPQRKRATACRGRRRRATSRRGSTNHTRGLCRDPRKQAPHVQVEVEADGETREPATVTRQRERPCTAARCSSNRAHWSCQRCRCRRCFASARCSSSASRCRCSSASASCARVATS